jgi:dihydrofolate synthase / folylpolyglutamate synthase
MSSEFSTPRDVFSWAESFTNYERNNLPAEKRIYRLDRMRMLLGLFNDPDRDLRIIHVAGTKGKGSTAALMASVLHAAGRVTGLYTSPHVRDAFERIDIPGEPQRPELLVRLGREVRKAIEALPAEGMPGVGRSADDNPPRSVDSRALPGGPGPRSVDSRALPGGFAPTTFELYTLLAFLYFRDAGCEEAVVEVGIGGRLDATNVVLPAASVITPLDLEHTDVLGDTIEKIAFEKAGIIKPGVPAFVGLQPPSAKEVFRQVARDRGSPLAFLDEEARSISPRMDRGGTSLIVQLAGEDAQEFRLSMLGEFQAENAALAYLALHRTRPEITLTQFRDGFQATRLPGRMELWAGSPVIVLDGAHTPLAVTRLLSSFRKVFPGEAILLFGSVAGKNPRAMAEILAPAFPRIIVSTPAPSRRASPTRSRGSSGRSIRPQCWKGSLPRPCGARARSRAGRAPSSSQARSTWYRRSGGSYDGRAPAGTAPC